MQYRLLGYSSTTIYGMHYTADQEDDLVLKLKQNSGWSMILAEPQPGRRSGP